MKEKKRFSGLPKVTLLLGLTLFVSVQTFSLGKPFVKNLISKKNSNVVDPKILKLAFYAKDSTNISKNKEEISLYGNASITSKQVKLSADVITYNSTTRIMTAHNVQSFKFQGKDHMPKINTALTYLKLTEHSYEIVNNK